MRQESWAPPTLRTRRLVIRPFRVEDVEGVHAYAQAFPADQFGGWLGGDTPGEAARYIADTVSRYGRPPRADLAVTLDNRLVGGVGWRQVWVTPMQVELGWVLHPEAAGKHLATEAVSALLDHLFGTFPELVRVEARVRASDPAGIRLLEGLGFCREGVLRRGASDGDGVLFGLLRNERVSAVGSG